MDLIRGFDLVEYIYVYGNVYLCLCSTPQPIKIFTLRSSVFFSLLFCKSSSKFLGKHFCFLNWFPVRFCMKTIGWLDGWFWASKRVASRILQISFRSNFAFCEILGVSFQIGVLGGWFFYAAGLGCWTCQLLIIIREAHDQ